MAKFLFSGSYTSDGAKGLLKEGGSSRRAMLDEMIGSLGGTVEAFYFASKAFLFRAAHCSRRRP